MTDDPHRLSPYVRDEATLQRGIEQTALAQTRATMSNPDANVNEFDKYQPSTAQVQPIHADMVEKVRDFYLQFFEIGGAGEGIVLTAEHCQELVQLLCAQAQADQQARLRALVGKWRDKSATDGLFIDVAFPGDTVGRIANQQRNRCADELEAVLGGKE